MGRPTLISQLEPPAWEIELALAWLSGELNLAGVAKARGNFNASNSLAWVAPRLKAAFAAGRLAINKDRRAEADELDKPPEQWYNG